MTHDDWFTVEKWADIIDFEYGREFIFAFEQKLLELLNLHLGVKPEQYVTAAAPYEGLEIDLTQLSPKTQARENEIVKQEQKDVASTQLQAEKPVPASARKQALTDPARTDPDLDLAVTGPPPPTPTPTVPSAPQGLGVEI